MFNKKRLTRIFASILLITIIFLGAFLFTGTAYGKSANAQQKAVATSYALPSWWAGYHCDNHKNIQADPTPMAIWNGLEVCKPLPGKSNVVPVSFFPGWSQENEFQCTELVKRYLYLTYGVQSLGATNGSQVVDNYTAKYSIFHKMLNNGSSSMTPVAGDVLSYGATGTIGHTSIVTGVNVDGSINVIQQNIIWAGSYLPIDTLTATWNPGQIALISGDINQDNSMDILDYNILMSCYGSKACSYKTNSDLNDDGVVDGIDYNIWLRNSQTQHGA